MSRAIKRPFRTESAVSIEFEKPLDLRNDRAESLSFTQSDKAGLMDAVEERITAAGLDHAPPKQEQFTSDDIIRALKSNEDGDAWLYKAVFRNRMVFDHSEKVWFVWFGHYWKEDDVNRALESVEEIVEIYDAEYVRQSALAVAATKNQDNATAAEHTKNARDLLKRIADLQRLTRKKNVLELARSGESGLGVSGNNTWDRNPWLLGCSNGIIDLKTGYFLNGFPEDYIQRITNSAWSRIDEPCPVWESFIMQIFNNDIALVEYFQRLLGYALTGKTTEHIFLILHGRGRNGKTTVIEIIHFVLGDLAGSIPAETVLDQKQHSSGGTATPELMALRGRRIVWADETNENRRFNIGKVKWLCGGDTITGRHLFGKMASFKPTHTLFLITNHKPKADSSDYAFWQRVHLIPFELSFVDEPKEPFERVADKTLIDRLKAEATGILAWLVRGCLEWQRIGLCPPECVKSATADYQKDQDTIGQFIDECCQIGPGSNARAGQLYSGYTSWCKENGLYPVSSMRFAKHLTETMQIKKDRSGSGMIYREIAYKGEYETSY